VKVEKVAKNGQMVQNCYPLSPGVGDCLAKCECELCVFGVCVVHQQGGAKGLGVLPLFPIFRHFFIFLKNLSSYVISVAFSRENCCPPKRQKRPKIAKHTLVFRTS